VPLGRKLLPQVEHAHRRRPPILRGTEVVPEMCNGIVLEHTGVLPRRVFHVQNGVRDGAVIELAQRLAEVGVPRVWVV